MQFEQSECIWFDTTKRNASQDQIQNEAENLKDPNQSHPSKDCDGDLNNTSSSGCWADDDHFNPDINRGHGNLYTLWQFLPSCMQSCISITPLLGCVLDRSRSTTMIIIALIHLTGK
jgi:hypothetical protein